MTQKFIDLVNAKILLILGNHRVVWLLLGASLIYYLTYFNYGIDLDDEGFLLVNASSILIGLWPMADFFSYQPLSYFLLAASFKIFGNGVLAERLLLLALLLLNIRLIYYCSSKLLPVGWRLMPAIVYAFAPGPWYKVFFISHILISVAMTLCFIEKPTAKRAFGAGLTCGLAIISRIEAGVIIAVLVTPIIFLAAWIEEARIHITQQSTYHRIKKGCLFELAFLSGSLLLLAITIFAYWTNGKLPNLVENTLYYYNYFNSVSYINSTTGIESTFSLSRLLMGNSFEILVWAVAMTSCIVNLIWFGWHLIKTKVNDTQSLLGFTVAIFGIGSMGYTYFYVWNSRMLSSFAIVYINYFFVIFYAYNKLYANTKTKKCAGLILLAGSISIFLYLYNFIKTQNYSGSYTTKISGMIQLPNSKLENVYIYPGQDKVINDLKLLTAGATDKDFLIPMSESTTLSYLSNLENPTYYRLFVAEFSHPGAQEKAIQTFEQYKVRYFVARRSQFLGGPRIGSDLEAYAPKIRAYLLDKYDVTPVGEGFVLLTRK